MPSKPVTKIITVPGWPGLRALRQPKPLKVYSCTTTMRHSGGCIVVAANSEKEALALAEKDLQGEFVNTAVCLRGVRATGRARILESRLYIE